MIVQTSDALDISIHAPVKGATCRWTTLLCRLRDFNPRSREGSDLLIVAEDSKDGISIHAPVKGATSVRRGVAGHHLISIHAPVKGATRAP